MNTKNVNVENVGYYLDASQPRDQPTRDAEPICVVCGEPWTDETVRTHGVMWTDGPAISLYYRTHRDCDDALDQDQKDELAQAALTVGDSIARQHGRISGPSQGAA